MRDYIDKISSILEKSYTILWEESDFFEAYKMFIDCLRIFLKIRIYEQIKHDEQSLIKILIDNDCIGTDELIECIKCLKELEDKQLLPLLGNVINGIGICLNELGFVGTAVIIHNYSCDVFKSCRKYFAEKYDIDYSFSLHRRAISKHNMAVIVNYEAWEKDAFKDYLKSLFILKNILKDEKNRRFYELHRDRAINYYNLKEYKDVSFCYIEGIIRDCYIHEIYDDEASIGILHSKDSLFKILGKMGGYWRGNLKEIEIGISKANDMVKLDKSPVWRLEVEKTIAIYDLIFHRKDYIDRYDELLMGLKKLCDRFGLKTKERMIESELNYIIKNIKPN